MNRRWFFFSDRAAWTAFVCVVCVLVAVSLMGSRDLALAQTDLQERTPDGGGEFVFLPRDEITDAQRAEIRAEIERNVRRLRKEGKLPPDSPEVVLFSHPLAKAPGVTDFQIFGISGFVDHNPVVVNQVRDYNCGTRTYDLSSGYNHQGVDMFTWPFGWLKMDNSSVHVVAGAPGTIVAKLDGNPDRSCGFGGGQWNAVYVQHSDGSTAWYGHMKNGSTTPKAVGQTVVTGEYLGVVGSSGNSTGPHLHFELYAPGNSLRDPYQGTCNLMNSESWWATQEPYRAPGINRLMTASAGPVFPACPNPEITNERTVFDPGNTIVTAAYYRDQLTGHQTQYALVRPDGVVHTSWSHTSPDTYSASYWWWSAVLPANAMGGTWKFRATYQSTVYEQNFQVTGPTPTPTATPTNTPTATPTATPAASGFEADVAPRASPDGALLTNDVVQLRRFVAGLDTVVAGVEKQRADCAPRATFGDGAVNSGDVVQARRYVAGLDPLTPAAGPTADSVLAMPTWLVEVDSGLFGGRLNRWLGGNN